MTKHTNYLFLIGAPKAGTTSLAAALALHPDIVVSRVKEPMFFTDYAERTWTGRGADGLRRTIVHTREDYERLFDEKPGAVWRLDASTDYLSCPAALDKITAFAHEPDVGRVQIAVLLRDPVDRAISQFRHTVRDGLERDTFLRALAKEAARRESGAHPLFSHVERSRYAARIAAWRERFPNLLILDYHRLNEGTEVLDRVLAALGLDPMPELAMERRNESFVYRNRWLGLAMRRGRALQIARRMLPKSLRVPLRQALSRANRTDYRAAPREAEALRAALCDDIAACLADPEIPTDRWTTALSG